MGLIAHLDENPPALGAAETNLLKSIKPTRNGASRKLRTSKRSFGKVLNFRFVSLLLGFQATYFLGVQ